LPTSANLIELCSIISSGETSFHHLQHSTFSQPKQLSDLGITIPVLIRLILYIAHRCCGKTAPPRSSKISKQHV